MLIFFSFSKTKNEMELLNAGMPPQAGIARIASGIRERVKTGSDYSKNDSLRTADKFLTDAIQKADVPSAH